SALMILQNLMKTINPDTSPKPCDYFDMIGGINTGRQVIATARLIAIILGRLRMSIDECISAYLSLSHQIFQKKMHRVTVKGDLQSKFGSDELAHTVSEVVNTLLHGGSVGYLSHLSTCARFVCTTSKEPSETVCLTSYQLPSGSSDMLNSVKIWEACGTTPAASSFFDPISIGPNHEGFVDGTTGAINPVWEIWSQAQLVFWSKWLEGKIKFLVSINTGVPPLKPFGDDTFHIWKTLISISAETEQMAEKFRRDKAQLNDIGRYYRLSVSQGLEEVGLEE
ncbi:acyl transferase/acyl hydrolase/lysophospholipase, partial [Calycina marina]